MEDLECVFELNYDLYIKYIHIYIYLSLCVCDCVFNMYTLAANKVAGKKRQFLWHANCFVVVVIVVVIVVVVIAGVARGNGACIS